MKKLASRPPSKIGKFLISNGHSVSDYLSCSPGCRSCVPQSALQSPSAGPATAEDLADHASPNHDLDPAHGKASDLGNCKNQLQNLTSITNYGGHTVAQIYVI